MAIKLGTSTDTVVFEFRGEDIELEYLVPTRRMYRAYQGGLAKNRSKRRSGGLSDFYIQWGKKLLVSFQEKDQDGNGIFEDEDGNPVTNETKDWKDMFCEYLPGLVANLVHFAFTPFENKESKEAQEDEDFLQSS